MKTVLKLGPADHGRELSLEDFLSSQTTGGYHYELIRGRVYVSPKARLLHDLILEQVGVELNAYIVAHPEVMNFLTRNARVFVPDQEEATAPEPDLAGYCDFPFAIRSGAPRWQDVSPVLVAEVVSEDDPDKDLLRNVELYEQVASIREYWIIDPRPDVAQLTLRVYRRRGTRWQRPIVVAAGQEYTPRLLPGFTLRLAPEE